MPQNARLITYTYRMALTLDKFRDVGRRISGVAMTPLVHREALSKAFPEIPKQYAKLPGFYLDHLKSLFKDPKKLKLALTDVTPLGLAGIASAIPMIYGLTKVMPHRRVQTITGGVGNILGGQLMQRTGLIGSGLGGAAGEALGRLLGARFDRPAARPQTFSDLAGTMVEARGEKSQLLDNKIHEILGKSAMEQTMAPRQYFHGSRHKLTTLRAGSYVTPHKDDAALFSVPWGSEDLTDTGNDPDGRPPTKLSFKGKPPADHPIYVYEVTGPVRVAATNTGAQYSWNRQTKKDLVPKLVYTVPSWHDAFLEKNTGKKAMEHQGIREPNPTTHDASIASSNPRLLDVPRQYGDARSVAGRGKWRPDVNTLSEALMLINPTPSIMAKDRFTDPTTGYNQMDGLHHDPVQIFDPTHQSVSGISGVPGKRIRDRSLPET